MLKLYKNKKALSPLVATFLLVAFSLVLGSVVMNIGKSYVERLSEEPLQSLSVVISFDMIDTPLKELQIEYITGKIEIVEYLEKEKDLIKE